MQPVFLTVSVSDMIVPEGRKRASEKQTKKFKEFIDNIEETISDDERYEQVIDTGTKLRMYKVTRPLGMSLTQ